MKFWCVSSRYGNRANPVSRDGAVEPHRGVDWAVPAGTPVLALEDGTIVGVGPMGGRVKLPAHLGGWTVNSLGDHGIRLRSLDGHRVWTYGHLSNHFVSVGERVTENQVIGRSGGQGYSTAPHLHLGLQVDGVWADPLVYLPHLANAQCVHP